MDRTDLDYLVFSICSALCSYFKVLLGHVLLTVAEIEAAILYNSNRMTIR